MELGTIASAAQVVDLGCRSLLGMYRFVRSLKDAPKDLLNTFEDLRAFTSLLSDFQLALQTKDPRLLNLSSQQLDRVSLILHSAGQVCGQLDQVLAECLPLANTSKAGKAWRALVSLKKEADIMKRCERLERLKHDLNRELQNHELHLLSTVK